MIIRNSMSVLPALFARNTLSACLVHLVERNALFALTEEFQRAGSNLDKTIKRYFFKEREKYLIRFYNI